MPKSSAAARALQEPTIPPTAAACGAADALLRAANECARQHERLGHCLELACSDEELRHQGELTALVDAHLANMSNAYERAATAAPGAKDEGWWHVANTLWHASREYARRNSGTNSLRLAGKHSKDKLTELAMEYELERSALLALKQAVTEYKSCRTGA